MTKDNEEADKWERKIERLDVLAHSDSSDRISTLLLPVPSPNDWTVVPDNWHSGWEVMHGPWLVAYRWVDLEDGERPIDVELSPRLSRAGHYSTQLEAFEAARVFFDESDDRRGVLLVLGRKGQVRYKIVRRRLP